jgi:toxin-antitoxin system PIN domain toxin
MKILMTSCFPDINVWLALSVPGHVHCADAWQWMRAQPKDTTLIFSRFTQLGLLRLLTNQAAMGERALTVGKAWTVWDRWLGDPRVELHPESRDLDAAFRETTGSFSARAASKAIGDCYLLAFAKASDATLVTFDAALCNLARRHNCPAVLPSPA